MSMSRNVGVIAIKNKTVSSAEVYRLNEIYSVIGKMESEGAQRVLLTYLDGMTLNTVLPVDESGKISIIQSLTSEFDYHESRQKMLTDG